MAVPSVRTLGIAAGALLGVPLALVVVVPAVVTFLGWLVAVPAAFVAEIVPLGDGSAADDRRRG